MNPFIDFLAALIPTFLISRALLWALSRWKGGAVRYVVVHAISAVLAVLLAAFGLSTEGRLAWDEGGLYAGAQAIWLIVDLLAYRGRQTRVTGAA